MKKRVLVGFQSSKYNNLSLISELNFSLKNKINLFEIFFDGFFLKDITYEEINKIKFLKSKGFKFSFHLPIDDYVNNNIDYLEDLIYFANELNCLFITIHFDKINFNIIERILKNLDNEIKLGIENVNPDKNIYNNLNYIDFMNEAKKIGCYSTVDLGHIIINKYNLYDYIKLLIENEINISNYHFHNNNGLTDLHNPIYDGVLDYNEILNFIIENNIIKPIILEHWDNNYKSLEFILNFFKIKR